MSRYATLQSIGGVIRRLRVRLGRSRVRAVTIRLAGGKRLYGGLGEPDRSAVAEAPDGGLAPLILCLHHGWAPGRPAPRGMGRRLLEELFEPALRELHAVMIAPDCPGNRWSDPANEALLLSLIAVLCERGDVDHRKIVVVGISDGATAAWNLMAMHPRLLSAIVPVAGWPQLAASGQDRPGPVYAVHRRADSVMPLAPTRAAIGMLEARAVPAALVVVEDVGHMEIERFVDPLRGAVPWLRQLWSTRP